MFKIGEFSKLVKLTVKTLRFYDEIGLLKPSFIAPYTGYRYYETAQLFPLQQIVALRQAGFSIEEIKNINANSEILKLLNNKEAELTNLISDSEQKLLRLSSIKKIYLEENTMKYQAIIKDLPKFIVYYKQFKVHDFSEYATIIPEIGAKVASANPTLECISPDYCYVEYLDGEFKTNDFNVEYAQAVNKKGNEIDGIKFKELPACQVACVMHKGSYNELPKAYAYLIGWIETNGYKIVGNGREQYIDGCWNKDDENDYLTEIQFCIEK